MNFRDVNPVYSPVLYFIGKNLQAMAFRIIWRADGARVGKRTALRYTGDLCRQSPLLE